MFLRSLRQRVAPRGNILRFFSNGSFNLPRIDNEPMLDYEAGTSQRKKLEESLSALRSAPASTIGPIINGKSVETNSSLRLTQINPNKKSHVVASIVPSTESVTHQAIDGALRVQREWSAMPFHHRTAIFLKAADLASTKYRYELLAATMIGQGKSVWQAEIDCVAEMADFWRFNVFYAKQIYETQPRLHSQYTWNRVEYRPLEGFVYAISPFNFTAIGSNLSCAPALMGNVVLWKPSNQAVLANHLTLKILHEAGLPPGVIQFLPGDGIDVSKVALKSPHFGGLHFTGSTATFISLWQSMAANIGGYKTYPRIVGETGGKNFHFLHPSADIDSFVFHTIRSAFEYSGQKCSALSRAYIPASKWPKIKERLIALTEKISADQFGDASSDFKLFLGAVIDEKSFNRIKSAIEKVKTDPQTTIVVGGKCDSTNGWYVWPTIIETKNPKSYTMETELFGPVLTVYVYEDSKYEETLQLCDSTSIYGLTGSLFCADRTALMKGDEILRNSCGNFYINDKSTGAVVGQQPFGGGRASGTNDKAGAVNNLWKWVNSRTVKESFVPIASYEYKHMK